MSGRDNFESRRGFLQRFVPTRHDDSSVETEIEENAPIDTGKIRLAATSRRKFVAWLSGAAALLLSKEVFADVAGRFDILKLTSPDNLAEGQKKYSILPHPQAMAPHIDGGAPQPDGGVPYTDAGIPHTDAGALETDMRPPIWLSDKVDNKDRKPKIKEKLDVQSPSPAFETVKRLQELIKSNYGQIESRLKTLGYIQRNLDNFGGKDPKKPSDKRHKGTKSLSDKRHNDSKGPSVQMHIDPNSPSARRYRELKAVYDPEYRVNSSLLKQWEELDKQMEPLRKAIKDAVMFERQTCIRLQRCANELPDIDLDGVRQATPLAASKENLRMRDYDFLPSAFQLLPFICVNVGSRSKTTNSEILETAKLLMSIVTQHMEVVQKREEVYLQIEQHSKSGSVKNKKDVPAMQKIYTEERKQNEIARNKWSTILADISDVIGKIVAAESTQTRLARGIQRCKTE